MKGLLYKDWAMIAGGYRSNFLFLLIFYSLFTVVCRVSFLAYAMVFVLGMYASSTVSLDESSHWDAYARTLPVSPRQLVSSKYGLTLLLTAAGVLLGLLMVALIPAPKPAPLETILGLTSASAVTLIYLSFVIPLSYRFGAAKARSWVSITILIVAFGPMALFMLLPDQDSNPLRPLLHSLAATLEASSLSELQWAAIAAALLVGIALLALLCSWLISVHIYSRKSY